jgi:hypothetical protein
MTHQQHGRLDEAKAAYLRAVKAGKSLAAAHNNLGVVCLRWRSMPAPPSISMRRSNLSRLVLALYHHYDVELSPELL